MTRFTHSSFQVYGMADLPLGRDIYMMDELYIEEWESENIKRFGNDEDADPYGVGYITPVHVSAFTPHGLEISWYPNTHDRFHEVKTFLPTDAFVAAALAYEYDKRVQLFVRTGWLRALHLRSNSIFAMIDAVDMTDALKLGKVSHDSVISLRDRLDDIASRHPDISLISFADSLLLKTNWTAGMSKVDVSEGKLTHCLVKRGDAVTTAVILRCAARATPGSPTAKHHRYVVINSCCAQFVAEIVAK